MASLYFPKIILFSILFLHNNDLKINQIEIKGIKKLKPKIYYNLPIKEEEIFNLQKEIVNFYLKEGFFDVKVNIAMKKMRKNFILFYFVEEGERYQIDKINIHSKFIKPDTLLKLIKEKDYSQENLNKIIKKIADFYWEIGYPFVKIDFKNFQLENKKVNFEIIIDEGELVKVNDLSAEGEIVISNRLLKKGSGFNKPFYFQKSLVEKMKNNITQNLNLTIDNYFLEMNEIGEYSLNFCFPTQRKNNFFFLFSYLPNTKNLYLNLNLKIFNFLTNLEEFNLEIEKWQNKNFYLFSYQQPYFFIFKKLFLIINFKSFDTLSSLFNFALHTYLPTKIDELSLNFIIQNELFNSALVNLPSFQTFSIGQELIFDNKIDNYHKGNYFSLKTLVGERKIKRKSSKLKLTWETKLEFLFPLFKEYWLFHNEILNGNIYLADTIYHSEKFSLGGKNLIRGFPEDKYLANFFLITRTHFKYRYKNIFFPYIFFDQGIGKDKRLFFLQSYGLGTDFFTKNGIFYLNFAFPIGFNIFDSRIYLGYIYYF